MIVEIKMYTVQCDNCKELYEDDYAAWNEASYSEQRATDSEWYKDGDTHYCPKCHTIDDEDQLVLTNPLKG